MNMTDQPPFPDSTEDSGMEPDRGSPPDTPRWVWVFGISALAAILLVVIVVLAGGGPGGGHGPGRHAPSGGGSGVQTAPTTVTEGGHTPPGGPGGHTPPSTVTGQGVQQP